MSCLLRGLKWPKTGLRENRGIVQFSDVYKHRPKIGWWPRTGGFTLWAESGIFDPAAQKEDSTLCGPGKQKNSVCINSKSNCPGRELS